MLRTFISSLALLLLAACSRDPIAHTPEITHTPNPSYTPYATYTLYPTYTTYPTYTPYPTMIPSPTITATFTPTPTPNPQSLAESLLVAFQSSEIPITKIQFLDYKTDTNELLGRPHQYVVKVSWVDSRVNSSGEPDIDNGGTLEIFLNSIDRQARQDYIEALSSSVSFLTQYVYGRDIMLLRLSHVLTPDEAKEYENIFNKFPLLGIPVTGTPIALSTPVTNIEAFTATASSIQPEEVLASKYIGGNVTLTFPDGDPGKISVIPLKKQDCSVIGF